VKIAIFSDAYTPDINGVVTSILTLQTELEKHGHTVYIVTTHPKLLETKVEGRIMRLPGIELKQLYGYVMSSPIHLKAMDIVKSWDLDVIHAHTEFGVGIFARIVARNLKIPLVSTYHTMYEDYTHYVNFLKSTTVDKLAKDVVAGLSKMYGESSTEIIAPSRKTKEALMRYGIKRNIHVVPTGMDLNRFSPENTTKEEREAIRLSCKVNKEDLAVVFVGRIAKEKSVDFIIQAFQFVIAKNKNCKLVIVGGGPQLEELKQIVKELKLENEIHFVGKVPLVDVPKYYHAFDIFSSVSLTETQGMTFMEALAAGLPVIARPDEILEDLILEGENGFYATTLEEWADKVLSYYESSKQEKELLRKNALASVSDYDSELFYARIMKVYQSAIQDYNEAYTIHSVKYNNDVVILGLENAFDKQNLSLTVDTFGSYGLRKDGKVDRALLEILLEEERYAKAYAKVLKRLTAKDRTRKEIYDWLAKNTELSIEQTNKLIDSLEEKGYIDDKLLVKSQIQNLSSLLQGRNKITRNLVKRGIAIETIEMAFLKEDDDEGELTRALKYAEKIQITVKNKSVRYKTNHIYQRLLNQGFSAEIVEQAMKQLNFSKDDSKEFDVLRKHAVKAHKRYVYKYEKSELRNRIFRYLVSQGFDYDDVYITLNEMEWLDE